MRDFTGVPGASGGNADDDTRWTPPVANSIVGELVTIITGETGGDAALNPASNGQLLAAVLAMIGRATDDLFTIETGDGERTITLGGGAVILKMGYYRETITSETSRSIVFATPFPTACWGVMPVPVIPTASIYRDLWCQIIGAPDETGFSINFQAEDSSDNVIAGFDWWALGN